MNIQKGDKIVIHYDQGLPLVHGQCPTCHVGPESMILMDFVPHVKPEEGHIYIKCICCSSLYQTKLKYVCD
jgi:hypothetical protein